MAKFKEKIEAIKLRREGKSIKEIAKKLGVSKSTSSRWCKDIELGPKQIERLERNRIIGSYKGRLKGAKIQKERRQQKIEYYIKKGKEDLSTLDDKDIFWVGLGLYWGEGSKNGNSVRFHNSDPRIIVFMMEWFKKICKILPEDFMMYITINKIHNTRLEKVKKYWSRITNIPLNQFRKPILIKAKNKKIYSNFNNHYGTLSVRISKSSDLFYKIQGWLKALNLE